MADAEQLKFSNAISQSMSKKLPGLKIIKLKISLALFSLLLLLTNPVLASSQTTSDENPYLINNVFVSASGKNPTIARASATDQAHRNAFGILLERLSIDEGFNESISADEISDMVHSEQITNEKIAGNNYSANFNIAFSESFVSNLLASKNINKGNVKPEAFLIIPIKNVKKKSLLWEKTNDWKLAWETAIATHPNPKIKLLKGETDDIARINPEMAEELNFGDFETILAKYKTDAAMIIYFNFDEIENKVSLNLKTIRKFQNKQIKLSFVNVNQLNSADLLSKVVEKTIEHISNSKESSGGSKTTIDIDVPISNLGDWTIMKSRLENINFLEEMRVNSIAKDLVKITIKFDKNTGDIIDLFAKYNFELRKNDSSQYLLFPNLNNQKSAQ